MRSLSAVQGAIARLDQLRLSALEELGEVRLALGKHVDLVDVLLQAVRDFPLAERLTAQLMLALYRSGRQADALRAYSALARRLDDELGAQPSAEVRQLEEDILLQRDRIDFVGLAPPRTGGPAVDRDDEDRRPARRAAPAARSLRRRRDREPPGRARVGHRGRSARPRSPPRRRTRRAARRDRAHGLVRRRTPTRPRRSRRSSQHALPLLDAGRARVASAELELLHASPSSDEQPAPAGPDYPSEQLRLLDGVARTISSLPTCPVLVVEDVQWADDSTLLVLRQLLRHPDIDRLLVIVTYRKDQVDERREKTIARLAHRDCTDAVHLSGLNEHEVRSLVRAAMGPHVVPALLGVAVTLRDATDGNPFHVRALLDELDVPAMASIDRDELEDRIGNLAPLGVRALVGERVARLAEQSRTRRAHRRHRSPAGSSPTSWPRCAASASTR